MCRMIGITNFEYRKHRSILERFARLAKTGKTLQGDSPGHADGWGIAYYKHGKAVVHKSANSILKEKDVLLHHAAQASGILIVHLRKSAWTGTTALRHAHPFVYQNTVFCHNGTIRDYKKLLPSLRFPAINLKESLDTEVYFYAMLNNRKAGLAEGFCKTVQSIKEKNTYTSLSCLFSDGTALYAYREFMKYPRYYTLYQAEQGAAQIVSSEPVAPSLAWKPLSKGILYVLPHM